MFIEAVLVDQRRTVGDYIRARREWLGLTQTQLEERSGITQRTISRIEANRNEGYLPQPAILRAIAHGLDVSVRELLAAAGYDEALESNESKDAPSVRHPDDPRVRFIANAAGHLSNERVRIIESLILDWQREQQEQDSPQ